MPDQKPDNPKTISATTSIETINQVMYKNWIWRNQFTVDTTMQAGHVFGTIKIHPQNCHDYLTYISKMFLTWTGSMKIRSRFQATFQFGGSFRLGWLPPKFNATQVQNLPIQTLTAYPNIDLDPKNTCWMEFQASEERNILFHWMEDLDVNTPESFGGWFVFYVAAPLVISGGAGNQVTMLVESAGSFEFAQLAPISQITPATRAIIDQDSIFTQVGCDDFARIEAIQICSKAIKSLPAGWFFARSSNNGYTKDKTSVAKQSSHLRLFLSTSQDAPDTATPFAIGDSPTPVNPNIPIDVWYFTPDVLSHQLNTNQEPDSLILATNGLAIKPDQGKKILKGNNMLVTFNCGTSRENAPKGSGYTITSASLTMQPVKIADIGLNTIVTIQDEPKPDTSTLTMPINESFVGFVSFRHRSFNIQTTQHGNALAASNLGDTNSQLYQLFAEDNPAPLLTLRLTPYGFFTTNAVDTDAVLTGKNLYLRYLQDLPMSTPLPQQTYEQKKFIQRAMACTKHNVSLKDMDDKLWSRF